MDPTLLRAYLSGLTEREAAGFVAEVEWGAQEAAEVMHFLLRDAMDGYRVMASLEPALAEPKAYAQGAFPYITVPIRQFDALVQQFYTPNFPVLRSLLGKHLTSKLRKDLDVIAESLDVRVRECQRNYDNIRRMFDVLDDTDFTVPLYSHVCDHFRLTPRLAWLYSCLIFILKHRMQIADTRRRLASVSCETFIDCASAMLIHWTAGIGAGFPSDVAGRVLPMAWNKNQSFVPFKDDVMAAGSLVSALPPPIALPPAAASIVTPGRTAAVTAPVVTQRTTSTVPISTVLQVVSSRSQKPLTDTGGVPGPTATSIGSAVETPDHSVSIDIAALSVGLRPPVLHPQHHHQRLPALQLASLQSQGVGPLSAPVPRGVGAIPPHLPAEHRSVSAGLPSHHTHTHAPHHSQSLPPMLHCSVPPTLRPFITSHLGSSNLKATVSPSGQRLTTMGWGSALHCSPGHGSAFYPSSHTLPVAGSPHGDGTDSQHANVVIAPGVSLDPTFRTVLKDLAGHLFKTRAERQAYSDAVLAIFFATSFPLPAASSFHSIGASALHTSNDVLLPISCSTPPPSALSTHRLLVTATSGHGRSEALYRRLVARLPGLLKHLKDMAIALGSVRVYL